MGADIDGAAEREARLMLRFLYRLLVGCPHEHTYREKRTIDGAEVLHLICHDCGQAKPAIGRTPEFLSEYRHARPSHASLKARRAPAEVVNGDFVKRGPK